MQFYDNNFFLNESHTVDAGGTAGSAALRWWSEGRIDTVSALLGRDIRLLKRAGATMIFSARNPVQIRCFEADE